MQANEFVKNNPWLLKHGAKGLKDIITDAKEYKYFCLSNLGHSYANHSAGVSVAISDLERLVESKAWVDEHGTIERAKEYANSPHTAPEIKERLLQAIADVEGCQ